jgi:PP-loop superfamily ATP-utilizing enzyme
MYQKSDLGVKTDLKNAIFESVRQSILNINTIGIAFSGGVDSALWQVYAETKQMQSY